MILLKSRDKIYEKIYKEVLSSYFKYLKESNLCLTPKGMSEMLRYCICEVLGLDTIYADSYIRENSFVFEQQLKIIMNKYGVFKESTEYKQGLLEACVHCIEMSRKKAGY